MVLEDNFDLFEEYETVNTSEVIPPGEFHAAPEYKLSRRENHGNGYHAHVEVIRAGGYVRSGYLLTINGKVTYAVMHGNNGQVLFDLDKKISGFTREINPRVVEQTFKGISERDMLKPSRDKAIELFELKNY